MIEDIRQIVGFVYNPIIVWGMATLMLYAIGIASIDVYRMFRG
jgi:hypothetical protein